MSDTVTCSYGKPSYNPLESLVPDLELCKKIPWGCFENSALAWDSDYESWYVVPRGIADPDGSFPAPTLQEIMLAIDVAGGYCPSCRYQANTWQLDYEDDPISDASLLPVLVDESDPDKPANAALKLWLGIKVE